MSEKITEPVKKLKGLLITDSHDEPKISKSREIPTPGNRDTNDDSRCSASRRIARMTERPMSDSLHCPYCGSTDFVRRGTRRKKLEAVQLYLCKSCCKTFTPQITKGKHYPLDIVLDAVSIYNLGYNLEQTCRIVNSRSHPPAGGPSSKQIQNPAEIGSNPLAPVLGVIGLDPISLKPATLSTWIEEFEGLCRYWQMRPYVAKKYGPKEVVIQATLAHRQLYRYRYHRGKCELLIENEYKHRRFGPLREFLEMVPGECPHQYFQDGLRASEAPLTFSKTAMIVRAKQNFANRLCEFVLQSVKNRQDRHERLQKFMLANDSVTVATEVPVYITRDDLLHMQTQLGFEIYQKDFGVADAPRNDVVLACPESLPKLITGHIDILQIRNGSIHILDYKPKAAKEQPIEQLTLYATALSRLTGLRLYEFKCAWFDEKNYFEFFPLHVLHKTKKSRRRRKIDTKEGTYLVNKTETKVESIRPI